MAQGWGTGETESFSEAAGERKPGLRRGRIPELTLGHTRADRRPSTQTDILVETAWFTGASYAGHQVCLPHGSGILLRFTRQHQTQNILITNPKMPRLGKRNNMHIGQTYKAQT